MGDLREQRTHKGPLPQKNGEGSVWKFSGVQKNTTAPRGHALCVLRQLQRYQTNNSSTLSMEITHASQLNTHLWWISFLTFHPCSVGRIWRPFSQSILFCNRWVLFTENTWVNMQTNTLKPYKQVYILYVCQKILVECSVLIRWCYSMYYHRHESGSPIL